LRGWERLLLLRLGVREIEKVGIGGVVLRLTGVGFRSCWFEASFVALCCELEITGVVAFVLWLSGVRVGFARWMRWLETWLDILECCGCMVQTDGFLGFD
ncbi:hypothetical protein Droror1_Dr00016541, partial [Drosera rotundifolia]